MDRHTGWLVAVSLDASTTYVTEPSLLVQMVPHLPAKQWKADGDWLRGPPAGLGNKTKNTGACVDRDGVVLAPGPAMLPLTIHRRT